MKHLYLYSFLIRASWTLWTTTPTMTVKPIDRGRSFGSVARRSLHSRLVLIFLCQPMHR